MGERVHWAVDPNRLRAPHGGLDGPTREVVEEMGRRDRIRGRAARAGEIGRPWGVGDRVRGGKPWPEYAREPYQWGVETRAQARVDAIRARSVEAAAVYEAQLDRERQARARRRRRARRRALRALRRFLRSL